MPRRPCKKVYNFWCTLRGLSRRDSRVLFDLFYYEKTDGILSSFLFDLLMFRVYPYTVSGFGFSAIGGPAFGIIGWRACFGLLFGSTRLLNHKGLG